MNKWQATEQLRRAIQMFVATLPDDQAMEVATVYPAWETDRAYQVSTILAYGENSVGDPQLYRVAQAHTSQADWTPDITPALYTPIGLTDAGYPVWSQPTGAHDAFDTDDIVDHHGVLYISLVDGNVWEPGAVGTESLWAIYQE